MRKPASRFGPTASTTAAIRPAPLSADSHVYLFSDNGVTTVLHPGRKYEEVAVNHLDGSFMASPAVAGHAPILRTKTNLYRIESP